MKTTSAIGLCLLLTSVQGRAADSLGFVPLPNEVEIGSLDQLTPFLLADGLQQELVTGERSIVDRPREPLSTSKFDMLTLNETGVDAGRYLFRTHEVCCNGGAGMSRTDLQTGTSETILKEAKLENVDGILWTPWETILFNEEVSYARHPPDDAPQAIHGLVYEITNPFADQSTLNVVARPALGSTSHEGMEIDPFGNLYIIDEWWEGGIFKFTPSTAGDLSSGQLFVLGDVSPEDGLDLGEARWIPLNDANGAPLEHVTDPTVDARAAAFDVNATQYQRPEDLEIGVLANGNLSLYAALTGDSRVISIELTDPPIVRDFVNQRSIDLATGQPVGEAFAYPDNLAIDSEGRIYVVEDNNPGDIWTALDADADGVAEGIGRWASLSTEGSEPSGLYFNPFNPHEAFVNVQHPSGGPYGGRIGDATFRILVPEPSSFVILLIGFAISTSTHRQSRRSGASFAPPSSCSLLP